MFIPRPQHSLKEFRLDHPHMLGIFICSISTVKTQKSVDFTVLCFMVTHLPVSELSLLSASLYLGTILQRKQPTPIQYLSVSYVAFCYYSRCLLHDQKDKTTTTALQVL
jgi:hypothetical protein